ncbi:hypothetical protein BCR44DRAFT_1431097 [Catenaria anguillulae PL171]|uniref:Uncharacterized protein n=1 Tax=Catenaria anguillulae PL171 TaxID=765915 RepID=A0A1Y2HS92_9FUNG|nr:hypothetical protein BCR44DRAFT_1431097 [Catenaria anguillulae PL171]
MIGPVRNNALLNLVMTTTIALESSFERLLKMHNRQRKGLRRQGVHAAAETGTRDGGGNSEIMVGESLLDVARSRADDQQNPQMNF